MLELDEYKLELQKYRQPLQEVKASLDIEGKEKRIAELDKAIEAYNTRDRRFGKV